MMACKFIEDLPKSAAENMHLDVSLLEGLKNEHAFIVHFYDWKQESATFGHFLRPEDYFNLEMVREEGLDIAKRPTGGGIIFHQTDLAFSVLVPSSSQYFSLNTLQNYAFINEKVKKAVERMFFSSLELLKEEKITFDLSCRHFCMAKPTKYDLMLGDKKIGGAAQRWTKFGYLHQGSILLGRMPKTYLKKILKEGDLVIDAMQNNSFPLLGEKWTTKELQDARKELKAHLKKVFNEDL